MGNVSPVDGIWTPDEGDNLDPEVWSATMAASIEAGIGVRLGKQEATASLRATTPEPFLVDSTIETYVRIPLNVNGPTGSRAPEPDFAGGNHATGITISGNVASIVTPGLYVITGQLTTLPGGFAVHGWDFFGKVNGEYFGLPDYGITDNLSYSAGRVTDTRILAEGDAIELYCGVGTDHVGGFKVQDALLTLTMLYAV